MQSHDAEFAEHGRTSIPSRTDAPAFAVVFDRPDTGPASVWGPFREPDTAERFARFVTEEIDPARVTNWAEAAGLPGGRPADPVTELLAWRDSVALPQIAAYRPA